LSTACDQGKQAIHYAAEFGSLNALKTLCKFSIDLSVKDNAGNSAAHLAAKNDKLKCIKFLHKMGLKMDKILNNMGRNVLHICSFYGSINSLHWLLEKDLDKHAQDC
jgi:hypothetical protein